MTGYGVASTTEAGVLVAGNCFENIQDPFHRGEGSSLVARDDHFGNGRPGRFGEDAALLVPARRREQRQERGHGRCENRAWLRGPEESSP
ncbi:hypothetical protein AB0A63_12920 [Lentzea sp. NPDC042327]|uniref:hypothetical protein n=1 Tax=Lentzea sp. NPDC042327 TaxID=3154801 RepID=UPI0033E3E8C0